MTKLSLAFVAATAVAGVVAISTPASSAMPAAGLTAAIAEASADVQDVYWVCRRHRGCVWVRPWHRGWWWRRRWWR
jgi:hypothetical protein